MNEDEEADADDLASEVETDRKRQKIRRDLGKFRRTLAGEGTAAIKRTSVQKSNKNEIFYGKGQKLKLSQFLHTSRP